MTRTHAVIGRSALVGIMVAAALAVHLTAAGQQPVQPCNIGAPEQEAWRSQAIRLARAVNTMQAKAFHNSRAFQPLSETPDISIPEGLSVEVALKESGYIFSIKDPNNPAGCALFSDEKGVIYDAQPIR
jgi:hypothetical protein